MRGHGENTRKADLYSTFSPGKVQISHVISSLSRISHAHLHLHLPHKNSTKTLHCSRGFNRVERTRTTLVLVCSRELLSWQIHDTIGDSPDVERTGVQGTDQYCEGNDTVEITKIAIVDGLGETHD